jgi:energy-coupling factor transporter ATP-binding protein EcfA2
MLIYGLASPSWIRSRLRQCRKLVSQRDDPPVALAVFEGRRRRSRRSASRFPAGSGSTVAPAGWSSASAASSSGCGTEAMDNEFCCAPYPGMRPFCADESDIYFGREAQTDALLDKLARHRFLAVVGPSGCGKSSLVRAGMIAALQTGFMAAAGADWRVAEMRPGDRPLARLANAMMRVVGHAAAESTAPLFEASLRRGPLGLVDLVRDGDLPPAANLLLLVDQFEEIFRYRQQGGGDEADAFVGLLLASAAQSELAIYIVITMRSDFLGDCALFAGLPEAINDSQYLTPRLSREQCRLAISGPARVFGGSVEPALVNRLLNDFGPNPDQLPLLQHALMRMWESARQASGQAAAGVTIGLAHYERIGGLARAMSDHADEVLDELSIDQRAIAAVMFRRLHRARHRPAGYARAGAPVRRGGGRRRPGVGGLSAGRRFPPPGSQLSDAAGRHFPPSRDAARYRS